MDHKFPEELFPSFYNCGPPDPVPRYCAGSWGSYDRVRPQAGSGPNSSWTFTSRHQPRGESWRHVESVPVPLLWPKKAFVWPLKPPDPDEFTKHMENFYTDHRLDAFGCMSELLGENFVFSGNTKSRYQKDSVHMGKVKNFLHKLDFKVCQQAYTSRTMKRYAGLMSDVLHQVPPQLLGSLLHEELTDQTDRLLFPEATTGGALAFIPFNQSDSQHGCLLYPGNPGLDLLTFHQVALQHQRGVSSSIDTSRSSFSFQLKGSIRQISSSALCSHCCVGVRSDYFCGVWRFSETNEPRLLQVVKTAEVSTCINVSPHILGEVLVASESGAVKLWTVGRGMQEVRTEESNLYFNAKSPWRWCEFSAHPRVMLYADRTGAELTDIRVNPVSGHTLFRISNTSECRSGERLILSKYLGDAHSFHHLIATQYSAYIMDERFPCVPVLKWDHMMESPPMSCHIVAGSSGSEQRTTKVLLGSNVSQEVTMLQYSGGRVEACSSRGHPQALLRPTESLKHLPAQIPHRLETATDRLSSPAAGLTCIQQNSGDECLCVLQLTAAGDIFYQILEPEQQDADASKPPAAEDEHLDQHLHQPASREPPEPPERAAADQNASETSSDEDVVGPTQNVNSQTVVPETPERNQTLSLDSDDSEIESQSHFLKRLDLQVVVNDDPELDQGSDLDTTVKESENVAEDEAQDAEEPNKVEETVNVLSRTLPSPVKLSSSTLVTWKHWLQKLMHINSDKKKFSESSPYFKIPTEGLLDLPDKSASEKEHVGSLRRDVKSCMSRRSLLVHGDASSPFTAPDLVPLPGQVDPEAWTDRMDRRLTASWRGEEAWRAWWKEELGMNREEKMRSLRRKRRRQKEARRAAGDGLKLTGSFTSSVSYQSVLDDFSDLSGWSSATSQSAWSDWEGRQRSSQGEDALDHETSSTVQKDTPTNTPTNTLTPTATPTATPQRSKDGRDEQQTPSRPNTVSTSQKQTQSSQRKNKRSANQYLNSLFASQDDASQLDCYYPDEGSSINPPAIASSSQLRSSQSVSLGGFRADLSQDFSFASASSQLLSQSSQSRWGSSQTSQPKKKKSRMGF